VNLRSLPILLSLLAASSAWTLGYLGGEDFWAQLASGERRLEQGVSPEPGSFAAWDVALARLDRRFGLDGIAVATAFAVGALVVLTFTRARLDPYGLVPGALVGLALYASAAAFAPRADLVGCVLLVVYLALLLRWRRRGWIVWLFALVPLPALALLTRDVALLAWGGVQLALALLSDLWPRFPVARGRGLRAAALALAAVACAGLCWTAVALWRSRDALDGSLRRTGFASARPQFMAPGAAAYLREHHLDGPIFAELSLGGYLRHALGPEQRLYVDRRNAPAELLEQYRDAMNGGNAWRALDAQQGFRAVVFSNLSFRTQPLRRVLAQDRFWRLLYSDPQAAVFLRGDVSSLPLQIDATGRWASEPPFLPPRGAGPQRLMRQHGMSLLLEYLRGLSELDQHDVIAQLTTLALASDPAEPQLLAFRGYARLRAANLPGAVEDLTEVVRLAPRDVAARLNLARALARSGRFDAALEQLDRAAERAPDHPGLAKLRARLQRHLAPTP